MPTMRREWMMLGPTPYEEDCVQLKDDDESGPKMRAECNKYIDMLEKRFANIVPLDKSGEPNAWFNRKAESHDFGTYYEAAVFYWENLGDPDEDRDASLFALFCENNCPATWDDDKVFTKEEYELWKQDQISRW